ncbi:hypothetical protein [Tamlana crocina]|uniref:Uncharacterized protein n=1 Tax=Tamlana crocina TaxID=393006 RepID=A0ABX1DBE6_9FLAO|nr:hypothetical protein [Tamlana crocina]NJX15692.1 hypothetical protein [Tamlana crocina]
MKISKAQNTCFEQKLSSTYFDNDRGSSNNAHPDAYNEDKIKLLLTLTEEITSQ